MELRSRSLRAWSARVLSGLKPVDTDRWEINYDTAYPERLANPIIILPILDKPGPLGNVHCAVLVQMLCLRTAIYCHAHSARHVRLRNLESCTKHSEYFSGIKNHCLDADRLPWTPQMYTFLAMTTAVANAVAMGRSGSLTECRVSRSSSSNRLFSKPFSSKIALYLLYFWHLPPILTGL